MTVPSRGGADRTHQGLERQARPQLPEMVTKDAARRARGRAREQRRDRPERNRAERDRAERRLLQVDRAERDRAQRDRAQRDRAERDRAQRDRAQRRELDVDRAERDRAERDRAERDRAERNRAQRDRAQRHAAKRGREDAVGRCRVAGSVQFTGGPESHSHQSSRFVSPGSSAPSSATSIEPRGATPRPTASGVQGAEHVVPKPDRAERDALDAARGLRGQGVERLLQ